MRALLVILVCICALELVIAQNNRKKFGSNKPNPDYEPPAEDYEGDALYYEDYDENGAKKDKDAAAKDDKAATANKEKTPKPIAATPRPAADKDEDKENKDAHPSLFAPRRHRTAFSPRPASRPKPTLPSFIRKPVDPGTITTPRTPPNRVSSFAVTTVKTSSVIRATTSRPSRFKNGGQDSSSSNTRRDRTTASPATSEDRGNRRFGSGAARANIKPARGNFKTSSE